MKHSSYFLSDSHTNGIYEKGEYKYIVITFDLKGAVPKVYDELSNELQQLGFTKSVKKRVIDKGGEKAPNEFFILPKNTYATKAKGPRYKNINRLRDDAEKALKDRLDPLLKYNDVEGFTYFVFVANEWSWACGDKRRVDPES